MRFVDDDSSRDVPNIVVDVAAVGDFGAYRDAARASMAVAGFTDPERSPLRSELTGPYPEQCAVLYDRLLGELIQANQYVPATDSLRVTPTPERTRWRSTTPGRQPDIIINPDRSASASADSAMTLRSLGEVMCGSCGRALNLGSNRRALSSYGSTVS